MSQQNPHPGGIDPQNLFQLRSDHHTAWGHNQDYTLSQCSMFDRTNKECEGASNCALEELHSLKCGHVLWTSFTPSFQEAFSNNNNNFLI